MAGNVIDALPKLDEPLDVEEPSEAVPTLDGRPLYEAAREAVEQAWLHDKDNRAEAAKDLTFLAGAQWPEEVRREREAEGRPMLTINRLPQFVRQVTNDIRQADLSIKVVAEDSGADVGVAKVYNGLLRMIQYRSSAKHVYSTAAEHQASCGIGWFRIASEHADDASFDQELRVKAIQQPLAVYCDPGAVEPDRSDAQWIAVTEMMPRETFKRRYPRAAEDSLDPPADWVDRPFLWSTSDGIRIAEFWYKVPIERTLALLATGETIDITDLDEAALQGAPIVRIRQVTSHRIMCAIVSGSAVLEEPHEWPGRHIPLIPVIGGEFPLEDKTYRYSVIRFARDPQQLYNYYRTATAEAIALQPKAPYLVTAKMIAKYKGAWDNAGRRNKPYLLYEPDKDAPGGRPGREHPPEMPVALANEAQIAQDDMKATTGIHDAALGARSNETSGVAIRDRKIESDVANYHFADNLQRALDHAGRILVDLIPRIYDNERIVRLMGDDGSEESVPINRVVYSLDGQEHVINDLSAGRFDVRVTLGRSYAAKRTETADAMLEFAKTVPGSIELLGDLLAKALDFPEADQIAKRLRNVIPKHILADPDDPSTEPPPPPDPMADPMARVDMEHKHAQALKAYAEARKIERETDMLLLGPPPREPQQPPPPETYALPPRAAAPGPVGGPMPTPQDGPEPPEPVLPPDPAGDDPGSLEDLPPEILELLAAGGEGPPGPIPPQGA